MKCSKCGKTFRDIKGMGAHYRKSHPGSMKARKRGSVSPKRLRASGNAMIAFEAAVKQLERSGFTVTYRIE